MHNNCEAFIRKGSCMRKFTVLLLNIQKLIYALMLFITMLFILYVPATFADGFKGEMAYQKKDYITAFKEFRKRAEKGEANGQSWLGTLYFEGQGVPQDYVTSAMWYEKASNQGYMTAQFELAKMYLAGIGVTKDESRAAVLMEKSANQGFLLPMYWIGMMYKLGVGVPVDNIQAHKWFNLSASYSEGEVTSEYITKAKSERDLIETSMTTNQIQEAQKLASDWDTAKKARDAKSEAELKEEIKAQLLKQKKR